MKISETYSHLNGLEFLLVHKPELWEEVRVVIKSVDAEKCKTKVSEEKRTMGQIFYSPKDMNKEFKAFLNEKNWAESRASYWVTRGERLIRKTLSMPPEEQKREETKAYGTKII